MAEQLQSPLMTEPEAAKYLRKSARNLWGLRNAGKIGFVKDGGRVFYRREHLDQYIAQNERTPTENTGPTVGK